MTKCTAIIKLKDIDKISIVIGKGRTLAEVKKDVGCDYISNCGLFCSSGPVSYLKIDGTVKSVNTWQSIGYGWTTGADIKPIIMPGQLETVNNAISCVWLFGSGMSPADKPEYPAEMGGKRGRTVMALTEDSLILSCSKDGSSNAANPETLQLEFAKMGCISALMLDGGQSSQCDFGNDQQVISNRKTVHNYLCVWLKKKTSETPIGKYKVTTNTSPLRIVDKPNGTWVGKYEKGTIVDVFEIKDGWARTEKGWSLLQWMTLVEKYETPVEPDPMIPNEPEPDPKPETPTEPKPTDPELSTPVTPEAPNKPSDDYAKEVWDKASTIIDGDPNNPMTKQDFAILLDLLGLI